MALTKTTCPTCEGKGCTRCNHTGTIIVQTGKIRGTR